MIATEWRRYWVKKKNRINALLEKHHPREENSGKRNGNYSVKKEKRSALKLK